MCGDSSWLGGKGEKDREWRVQRMGVPKKGMVALFRDSCLEEKKSLVVCSIKPLEDRLYWALQSHTPKCQRVVDSVAVAGSASAVVQS